MLRLDNTKISCYKNCPRMFYWQYVKHLRPKTFAEALFMGELVHLGIQGIFSKTMPEIDAIIKAKYKLAIDNVHSPEEIEKIERNYSLSKAMISAYQMNYAKDLDIFQPEHIEKEFDIPLTKDFVFYLKPDMIAINRETKKRVLFEHKTASYINASYLEKLPLDTQITSYVFGCKELKMPVDMIIYDVIKKTKSQRKLTESWENFEQRMIHHYQSPDNFYREELHRDETSLSDFKEQLIEIFTNIEGKTKQSQFYQNSTFCTFYGSCTYMSLCLYGEENANDMYYIDERK